MSYCVNCGVELAESEKYCPLCDTEVLNPRAPWKEPSSRPYPSKLDTIMRHIDRRYVAMLICTFLSIPLIISLLSDLLEDGVLSWSVYVIGAGLLLLVWVALPLCFRSYRMLTFTAINGFAALLYLLAIELFTEQHWFLPLGLPITASVTALLLLLIYLFRTRRGRLLLSRMSLGLAAAGLECLIVELCVDLFAQGEVFFTWSGYTLTSCVVLAVALQIIEHQRKLKEEIRKRLFY